MSHSKIASSDVLGVELVGEVHVLSDLLVMEPFRTSLAFERFVTHHLHLASRAGKPVGMIVWQMSRSQS